MRSSTAIISLSLGLCAGLAMADDAESYDPEIAQLLEGSQAALNSLTIEPAFESIPDDVELPTLGPDFTASYDPGHGIAGSEAENLDTLPGGLNGGDTEDFSPASELSEDDLFRETLKQLFPADPVQQAWNVGNLVRLDRPVENVTQDFGAVQTAGNMLDAPLVILADAGISQDGINLGNILVAETVSTVSQNLMDGAGQVIENEAVLGGFAPYLTQSGINAANIIDAEVSIGTGNQVFPEGVSQEISNLADFSPGMTTFLVEQTGINVGNVMQSETMNDVDRVFAGAQIVENTLILNSSMPMPAMIVQEGTNIANLVIAESVTELTQISTGTQDVVNLVLDENMEPITGLGDTLLSTTNNYVNVLVITTEVDGEDEVVTATQLADFDQTVAINGQHSQIGNSVTIDR